MDQYKMCWNFAQYHVSYHDEIKRSIRGINIKATVTYTERLHSHTMIAPMAKQRSNQTTKIGSTPLTPALTAPAFTLPDDPVAALPPASAPVAVVGPAVLSEPGAVTALGKVTSALILANWLLAAMLSVS